MRLILPPVLCAILLTSQGKAGSQRHEQLNIPAVVKADEQLWKNHPELKGRYLTMHRGDSAYRTDWMRFYRAAVGRTPQSGAFDNATLEAYVRHLLAMSPEVQVKIDDPKPSAIPEMKQVDVHMSLGGRSQDETFYVSSDGKRIVRGFLYDIAQNPFKPELDKLKTDLSPSFGAAGAPVVMVVFSDFQCPNCKEEAKLMRENIPAKFPTQVRLYFKNYPLEQIHPWAKPAAIAGGCVFRQSPTAFWKYHDWIYEHQAEITPQNLKDTVLTWAKSADLDLLQFGRCMDTKATEADIDKEIAEGRALNVDATPTTFINGRRLVGNYPWVNLEQIINGELNYQSTTHNAGEKCCEVSIPSPLKK